MKRPRWWFERREDALAEEMESHLAMAIADRVARGESVETATAAAKREFGNREIVRSAARDIWGWVWLEQLVLDFRYALRKLRMAPGFTAVAALSLAIGIGATVTMYAVIDAADVHALAYPHADRLVILQETRPNIMADGGAGPDWVTPTSPATFADWRASSHAYDAMGAFSEGELFWTQDDETERLLVPAVSPEFFSVLGASPILGRGIAASDTAAGARHVLVLSYGFWRQRFGGDRRVLGRTIQLTESAELAAPRETYTIIGVMPKQVNYPSRDGWPQGWEAARSIVPAPSRSERNYLVLARLRAGQSLATATAELSAIARRIAEQYPDDFKGAGVRVQSIAEQDRPFSRTESYTITSARGRVIRLAVVSLVLLLAMINIGNLLLARSAARDHEMAVRAALGASRGRLVQSLLVEAACITIFGASMGLALAWWSTGVVGSMGDLAYYGIVPALNMRVIAFALGVTAIVALGVGFIPAISLLRAGWTTRRDESPRASAGSARARLQGALLVGQIGAALTLLTGAGLLSKELLRISRVGFDFDPSNVLLFTFPRPPQGSSAEVRAHFRDDLIGRLTKTPGVVSVSVGEQSTYDGFFPSGRPRLAEHGLLQRIVLQVSPGFLRNLRIPLRSGRDFTPDEFGAEAAVAIVSASTAERFWRGENAIGKEIVIAPNRAPKGRVQADTIRLTVVGVMADPRLVTVLGPPPLMVLRPNAAATGFAGLYWVRVDKNPQVAAPALRRTFMEAQGAPLVRNSYGTAQALQIDRQLAEQRITTRALSIFAGIATLLVALGIHGLVAFAVAQRTREIGIRMALGARAAEVLLLVTRRGLLLTAAGVAFGVAGSLVLTRALTAMLYGTSPTDPTVFVGSAILLAAVVAFASYLPARRATRVDPMVALRVD